jgi:hypothetical protein
MGEALSTALPKKPKQKRRKEKENNGLSRED